MREERADRERISTATDNQVTMWRPEKGGVEDLAQVSSLGCWGLAVSSLGKELMRRLRFKRRNELCLGQRLVTYEI